MPWITPIVFKQATDESLLRLPSFRDGPAKISFRHVVHFYRDVVVSENTDVQRLTFETVARARQASSIPVAPVAVTFPEDADLVPADWIQGTPLNRVITDLAQFRHQRPLPLVFDIMDRGLAAPIPPTEGEEFYILTNSDIHLQPSFYTAVAEMIRSGWDVITINRRTIYAEPGAPLSALMLAEHGIEHPGFDCFIFPARMYRLFVKSRAACGGGYPMRSLLFNLVAFARRFLMVGYAHLTFHIGDSTYFADQKFADYQTFNIGEAQSIVNTLAQEPERHRRLVDFCAAHEGGSFMPAHLAPSQVL